MRWAIVLMTVAACNAIFGIKDTKQIDAAYYDAPIDAPFQCPGIGSNLVMSGQLHQEFQQECLDFDVSPSGVAAGICFAPRAGSGSASSTYVLATGTAGSGALAAAPGLPDFYTTIASPSAYEQYDYLFASPDGTRLYSQLSHYDYTTNVNTYATKQFTRQSDGSWQLTATLPVGSFGTNSTVFRGPTGDRFFHVDAQLGTIVEWQEDGAGGWTMVQSHQVSELGLSYAGVLSLTTDGLHMSFQGTPMGELNQRPLYTDRASESGWFRTPVPLENAPHDSAIRLTDDCARLYATGLGAVFSMQQR